MCYFLLLPSADSWDLKCRVYAFIQVTSRITVNRYEGNHFEKLYIIREYWKGTLHFFKMCEQHHYIKMTTGRLKSQYFTLC